MTKRFHGVTSLVRVAVIGIYYFSGTGNTAWVARQLAARLIDLGDEVTLTSCEHASALDVDPAAYDVVGVAFPVHASFAPLVFRDFLDRLPPGEGKPLFALTTAGYAAGDTAWYAAQPLQAKGYDPFLLANVKMGNNLHLPLLSPLPVTPPEKMEPLLYRARAKIAQLANLIQQREPYEEGVGLTGRALGIVQRGLVERFEDLAFKGFWADETCTRCGWCVRHCPVHAIEMTETEVAFGDKCIICMRCYNFCPVQAIQLTEATRDAEKYRRYSGPEGKPYPADSVGPPIFRVG